MKHCGAIVTHRGSSANWTKAAMAGCVHERGGRGCSLNLLSHWESGAAVNGAATTGGRQAGSGIVIGPCLPTAPVLAGTAAAVRGK